MAAIERAGEGRCDGGAIEFELGAFEHGLRGRESSLGRGDRGFRLKTLLAQLARGVELDPALAEQGFGLERGHLAIARIEPRQDSTPLDVAAFAAADLEHPSAGLGAQTNAALGRGLAVDHDLARDRFSDQIPYPDGRRFDPVGFVGRRSLDPFGGLRLAAVDLTGGEPAGEADRQDTGDHQGFFHRHGQSAASSEAGSLSILRTSWPLFSAT